MIGYFLFIYPYVMSYDYKTILFFPFGICQGLIYKLICKLILFTLKACCKIKYQIPTNEAKNFYQVGCSPVFSSTIEAKGERENIHSSHERKFFARVHRQTVLLLKTCAEILISL